MQPIVNVDPRIYGGEAPSTTDVPVMDPERLNGGAAQQPYVEPARVSQEGIGAGSSAVAEGQAAIQAANRERASIGDSALASVKSWTTTRVWDYFNQPDFAYDGEFDPKPYINHAPVSLSADEHKFLAQSTSEEMYNYRLDNLLDQRKLYEQMGDHPVISGIVGMADPVYLAIDLASMGTATALTGGAAAARGAARALSGAGSFAGAYAAGKIAQQVAPMDDKHILIGALIQGAASATLYRAATKRFERVDPTYPSDELTAVINRAGGNEVGIEARIAAEDADVAYSRANDLNSKDFVGPRRDVDARIHTDSITDPKTGQSTVQAFEDIDPVATRYVSGDAPPNLAQRGISDLEPRSDAYTVLGKFENDKDFGPLIRQIRQEHGQALSTIGAYVGKVKRAAYYHGDHAFYMDRGDSAFVALHEAMHGMTAAKIEYGLANPGTAHGRLVAELDAIRQQVKTYLRQNPQEKNYLNGYFTKNMHEFAAGLYSHNYGDFTKLLAKLPAQGSRNALTKVVDVVRKLMGIKPGQQSALTKALGITDDLMKQKLDIVAKNTGDTLAHLAPEGTPAQVGQQVGGWWERMWNRENKAEGAARGMEWSLHKTLRGKGTEGQRVADTLVDDPINMTGDSAVSQKQAIRNDLATKQYAFEDALKAELAKQGFGLRQRIFNSGDAIAAQANIERKVYEELMRRENAVRRGQSVVSTEVDPTISKLADLHDAATKQALDEMKAAGVRGADTIEGGAGYATRKWSVTKLEEMEQAYLAAGATERQARKAVRTLIADGIMRTNATMPRDLAEDFAQAITERTRNKGYFEDTAPMGTMGDDGAQGIRALLDGSGITPERMKRIEDFLTARKDDAGMMSNLKHRISMDTTATVTLPGGETRSIIDLLDTGVTRNLDGYLDDAAGQAALARKGLTDSSAITKLRGEYLHGIASEADRKVAAKLFDDTIKAIKGQPVGEELNQGMRRLQAITTSVGLANSGLWQTMEYANIAAKYGLVKTAGYVLKSMPLVRDLIGELGHNGNARSLVDVLAHNSSQDMRIRPFVQKLEDNFVIPVDDRLTLGLQQAKQLVPYLNAMKFVHHHQATVTANLISDSLRRAVNGDKGAIKMLEKYGLEGHTLDSIRGDLNTHGLAVDSWSEGTWAAVRGPLSKMMDDAVLRNRTGEIPAFAQFSTLGKFIFTFRSFVLGAHNKVLAGTLGRHGFSGLGLLMMYQFPLAMASSYAVSVQRGKPETDIGKLASTAIAQQSAMGLFSELWGVVSGDKNQFGSSGLMAIDRLYKTGSQVAQGKVGGAASSLAQSVPLLAIMPGVKALAEQLK
ncbi:internal virion protein with endolysin domain [Ralstonia phage RSB3]|uniref:Putative internal core protein n=1 Tax=Ralstonia phage RSB3 TaxID=1402875 RepID=U3TK92_9CAUD|nr:internal virion protein with endolysin domain [Ralstonia phage RSB3]BAN92353.1 putative internal core protein [Ralstonia phage RSB3]